MLTRGIGQVFIAARRTVGRWLLRLQVTPNRLTGLGCLATLAAGACLAGGRFAWATVMMILAGACDMLDGEVARQGNLRTAFGAFLDSTLDRVSDCVLYGGAALYFAGLGNRTYALLALSGLTAAITISYARSRAENIGVDARAGLFERGERYVVLLVGVGLGHLTTALWLLAIHPHTTALHRILVARRGPALSGQPIRPRLRPLGDLVIWNHARGSWPYDLIVAAYMLTVALVDVPATDWLTQWLQG